MTKYKMYCDELYPFYDLAPDYGDEVELTDAEFERVTKAMYEFEQVQELLEAKWEARA